MFCFFLFFFLTSEMSRMSTKSLACLRAPWHLAPFGGSYQQLTATEHVRYLRADDMYKNHKNVSRRGTNRKRS